jgi:hypothetical protein
MAHGIEVRQSDGARFFRTDTAALFHISSLEVGNPSVGNWEAIRFRPDVYDGSAGHHYIHFLATTSPGTDYLLPHVTYYAAMEVPLESVLFAHVYLEPTRNDHGGNVGWSLSWGRGEDVVYPNGETIPAPRHALAAVELPRPSHLRSAAWSPLPSTLPPPRLRSLW